jgi:hypothetical protein
MVSSSLPHAAMNLQDSNILSRYDSHNAVREAGMNEDKLMGDTPFLLLTRV